MSLPPLTPEQLIKPRHFELRISLIFMAIFISSGVHLPYFPVWLEANGFNAEEIAVILAAPMFLRVVTTPIISTLADRANDRADVLIGLCGASLAISSGYFLPPTYGIVLGVSLLLAIVWTPHSPLVDSLALSGVRRFGCDYSKMRIWGSVIFFCANFFGGVIIAQTSEQIVPVMISVGLAVGLAVSFLAPRLGRPRLASPLSTADLPEAAPSLMRPYFLFFVASAGVTVASHALLYAFVSIYWKSLGISDSTIGILWAFAVVAEVGMFMVFTRLFGRVPATTTLMLASIAAMVRWIAFPLIWPLGLGVFGFFLVQALHAVSTGLILLSLQKMIAETVSEARTGAAQGINFFASGFGLAIMTLLSGPIYEAMAQSGFYVMAAVALGGLGLGIMARRSAPKRGLWR
ncbi:MFS transporter, PPP family, 3-phenylpropionic acid transporter [Mesorhizobium albiziae]|uniref:MFS transporter, PPP family, 3-phenylpropionic acid transporter n=1 Tax=Neomesorhizobium albiziae TaxID=335020 RepID=A0A1I3YNS3_9HYPH|nr:MFS transporter [Mesorhizobium albiziae]GLS33373.1 MFS transporter [Mesorhizobium albiziae]SFK33567.1 MFS transporter, PPP family, 3-phenylpropionic acid transporter [Mesorhizobium albiziae]